MSSFANGRSAADRLKEHDDFITDALLDHVLLPINTIKVNESYKSAFTTVQKSVIKYVIKDYCNNSLDLRDNLLR